VTILELGVGTDARERTMAINYFYRTLFTSLLLAIGISGCETMGDIFGDMFRRECVSYTYRDVQVPYCCVQGNGYCQSTCYRTQNQKVCSVSRCKSEYVERDGKCMTRDELKVYEDSKKKPAGSMNDKPSGNYWLAKSLQEEYTAEQNKLFYAKHSANGKVGLIN
jgi:hypothetical protein